MKVCFNLPLNKKSYPDFIISEDDALNQMYELENITKVEFIAKPDNNFLEINEDNMNKLTTGLKYVKDKLTISESNEDNVWGKIKILYIDEIQGIIYSKLNNNRKCIIGQIQDMEKLKYIKHFRSTIFSNMNKIKIFIVDEFPVTEDNINSKSRPIGHYSIHFLIDISDDLVNSFLAISHERKSVDVFMNNKNTLLFGLYDGAMVIFPAFDLGRKELLHYKSTVIDTYEKRLDYAILERDPSKDLKRNRFASLIIFQKDKIDHIIGGGSNNEYMYTLTNFLVRLITYTQRVGGKNKNIPASISKLYISDSLNNIRIGIFDTVESHIQYIITYMTLVQIARISKNKFKSKLPSHIRYNSYFIDKYSQIVMNKLFNHYFFDSFGGIFDGEIKI